MSGYGVRLERMGHKDRIALITLDRPERRNTMNEAMWSGLEDVTSGLERQLPRAVIITGAGDRAFCAGMDVNPDNPQIGSLVEAVQKHEREPVALLIRRLRTAIDSFVTLPVPIIAAMNGLAYGGGAELAIRCDLRVMDPGAVICFSEVRLGLMPDWGGGVTLARLIGHSKAADLILTARRVMAQEAYKLDIVNRISKPGKALEESIELAELIARNGPMAVRSALEAMRRARDLSHEKALEAEEDLAVSLIATGECYHGVMAFLSKEEPDFPDI
ncbi:MAG: enoyl-CoA hydratase/isomerase family protein [Pseudomonadota bacterium]